MNTDIESFIKEEISEHIKITDNIAEHNNIIIKLVDLIINCFENDGKLLVCGNGGSAADAQHLSSEIVGRYESDRRGYPALSLSTDNSALTAISNDFGFKKVFSRQIESLGKKNDVLIILSTSGNSENLISAIEMAKKMGIFTFGFLGKDGGKALKILDLSITIRSSRTCRIQEMHALLIHIICGVLDKKLGIIK